MPFPMGPPPFSRLEIAHQEIVKHTEPADDLLALVHLPSELVSAFAVRKIITRHDIVYRRQRDYHQADNPDDGNSFQECHG